MLDDERAEERWYRRRRGNLEKNGNVPLLRINRLNRALDRHCARDNVDSTALLHEIKLNLAIYREGERKTWLKIEVRRRWAAGRKTGAAWSCRNQTLFDGNKDFPTKRSRWSGNQRNAHSTTHRPIYSSIGSSLCSQRIGNSLRWICHFPIEWTRIPCWTQCPRPRVNSQRVVRISEWRPRYVLHPARCSPILEAWARCGADSRGSSTRCGSISWKLASGKA